MLKSFCLTAGFALTVLAGVTHATGTAYADDEYPGCVMVTDANGNCMYWHCYDPPALRACEPG